MTSRRNIHPSCSVSCNDCSFTTRRQFPYYSLLRTLTPTLHCMEVFGDLGWTDVIVASPVIALCDRNVILLSVPESLYLKGPTYISIMHIKICHCTVISMELVTGFCHTEVSLEVIFHNLYGVWGRAFVSVSSPSSVHLAPQLVSWSERNVHESSPSKAIQTLKGIF